MNHKILPAFALFTIIIGLHPNESHGKNGIPTIEECAETPKPACLDLLFGELNSQIMNIKDNDTREGYSTMPTALFLRAGKLKQAEEAAENIENPDKRDQMLGHVGVSYATDERIDDARQILTMLKSPYEKSLLIAAISFSDMKSGDVTSHLNSLKSQLAPEFAEKTLADIARMLINNGQYDDGVEVTAAISDPRLQSHLFALVAHKFASVGQVQKSFLSLDRIKDPELKIMAMGGTGTEFQENGYLKEAKVVYHAALDSISMLNAGDPAKNQRLDSIVRYLIGSGYISEAEDAVNQIKQPSSQADLFHRIGLHYADKHELQKMGKYFDISASISDEVSDPYRQLRPLHFMAVRLAKEGEVTKALEFSNQIMDLNGRSNTVSAIGNIILEGQNLKLAEQIYSSIEHVDIRTLSLVRLAKFLIESGEVKPADELLAELRAILAEAPIISSDLQDGVLLRGSTVSSLSSAYIERGDFTAGRQIAETITDPDQRISQLITIFGHAVESHQNEFVDSLNNVIYTELQTHPRAGNVLPLISYLATHSSNMENIELHRKFSTLLKDERSKSLLYSGISQHLAINGNHKLALQFSTQISDPSILQAQLSSCLHSSLSAFSSGS